MLPHGSDDDHKGPVFVDFGNAFLEKDLGERLWERAVKRDVMAWLCAVDEVRGRVAGAKRFRPVLSLTLSRLLERL